MADVGEKLLRGLRRRRLRVGAADVDAGVVVGAADAGAAVGLDVDRGGEVELAGPRAVADLPDREELGQAAAVARREGGLDRVEGMGERAGDLVLVQVGGAGLDVAGMGLEPVVVGGGDPVAEHVHGLGLAGEPGRELLGDEDVGAVGDLQAARDRVVVGDRHEVHAAPLREVVDLLRRGRALGQPDAALHAQLRDLRGGRMTMHVGPGTQRGLRCDRLHLVPLSHRFLCRLFQRRPGEPGEAAVSGR